jgi:hypothetical protein
MQTLILNYLPYLLSALTIWMTLWAGNMDRRAWTVGLYSQALWLVWIIAADAWGFLILTVFLAALYLRNYRKWNPK